MDKKIDSTLKISLLNQQSIFKPFTSDELAELAMLLIPQEFSPGEIIVYEGEPVDSVYLIVSGIADVCHQWVENGETLTKSIAKLYAGQSIGLNDTGFYSISGVRTATVRAETPLMVLYLSVAAFHGFSLMHKHVNELMRKNAEEMLKR